MIDQLVVISIVMGIIGLVMGFVNYQVDKA